jgi:hypothetical protein
VEEDVAADAEHAGGEEERDGCAFSQAHRERA